MNTIATLKDSISGILSGIELDNEVTNLFQAIERAVRVMAVRIDVPEASASENIILYSGVDYYPAPETIFGSAVTDFRPQGNTRSFDDYVYRKGISLFNRTKCFIPNGYTLDFEYNKGVAVMGVIQRKTLSRVILDTMSDTSGWVAGGTASGLVLDQSVYYNAPASLRFNLAITGPQGYLEKTLDSQIDLTSYQGVGVIFLAVYLPSVTGVTSIGMRIGNDSANYYDVSATEGFLGSFIANDWMLVALDLANASQVGTVDITKVDYLRTYFDYSGAAIPNVRVGGAWISLPSPHKVFFQTAAIFQSGANNPSSSITDAEDNILLNESAYTILEFESASAVLLQSGAGVNSPLYSQIQNVLHGIRARNGIMVQAGLYDSYEADNPSQEIRQTDNYYLN